MTNIEICDLAVGIISTITNDLQNGIYQKLGGSLKINWVQASQFNAWAESPGNLSQPPEHKICLHYELAIQLYKDCEEFCDFATTELISNPAIGYHEMFGVKAPLPEIFTRDGCVKNMFIAALTWIFFHELGHLTQEHGVIRDSFGKALGADFKIHEQEAMSSGDALTGKASVISHVTEMAADFEATHFCTLELIRHFTDEELVGKDFTGEEFIGSIYLLICGLSFIFHRFRGSRSGSPEPIPSGSHPHPTIRLESYLPQLYEFLDYNWLREHTRHTLDRVELVRMCGRAAFSGAAFWYSRRLKHQGKFFDVLVRGIRNRPEMKEYFKVIIETWDEIEPTIKNNRRFGSSLGVMTFSDFFRNYVSS
ncbi:hypothetical protein PS910_03819 [Pseudomonas fluorescens]|nr:hypothetical protein PS910_03819 [Pseudomonas fluorescens]